jgi:hypothetical protein
MRTPRVSAHPDFGQIGPLYPQISSLVSDFAKIVDFVAAQFSATEISRPSILVLNFALNKILIPGRFS